MDQNQNQNPITTTSDPKTIYFAAALFNTKECHFNAELCDRLEAAGYKVKLPQRDGFEMSKFQERLRILCKDLSEDQFNCAVSWTIYLLDLGHFLYSSDICLANLDEPLDPGVIVEMIFAKMMGKHIIGYRTEMRTTFG